MAEFADSCFPFEFVAHSKALRLGEWPCLWHLGLTLASPGWNPVTAMLSVLEDVRRLGCSAPPHPTVN